MSAPSGSGRFDPFGMSHRCLRTPDGWSRRTADIADRRLYVAIGGEAALQAPPREGAQWVPKLPFHCERELGFAALSRHSGRRWGAPHRIKKEGAAQYYRAISKRRAHRNYPTSTIRARPDSRRCRASRPSARRWCRRYKGRTARPPRVLTDERG